MYVRKGTPQVSDFGWCVHKLKRRVHLRTTWHALKECIAPFRLGQGVAPEESLFAATGRLFEPGWNEITLYP